MSKQLKQYFPWKKKNGSGTITYGSVNGSDDQIDVHQPLLPTAQVWTEHGRDRHRGESDADVAGVINEADDVKTVEDIQQELDEVVEIMVENVNRILERDEKIADLEICAENIRHQAEELRRVSKKLLMRYYWRRHRCWILIAVFVFFCLIVGAATGWIFYVFKK